jgi:hypothetical protein
MMSFCLRDGPLRCLPDTIEVMILEIKVVKEQHLTILANRPSVLAGLGESGLHTGWLGEGDQ